MSTNTQTHTDLIFSIGLDKTVVIALAAVCIVAVVAFIYLARRRQRQ
jgi:hypothetical protein